MSSPLPLFKKQDSAYEVQVSDGPFAGKTFAATMEVCLDPLCPCQEVTFQCTPVEPHEEGEDSPITFALDIEKRQAKPSSSPRAHHFADAVTSAMTPNDWDSLYLDFLARKEELTETADFANLPVQFPADVMRDPSVFVSYRELLPFGTTFHFPLQGETWYVNDHYCVNPDCDCQNVIIDFLPLAKETNSPEKALLPAVVYDGATRTFRPMNSDWTGTPTLESLEGAFRKTHPALDNAMKKRHLRLRLLYRKTVERTKEKLNSIQNAIGLLETLQKPKPRSVKPVTAPRPLSKLPGTPQPAVSLRQWQKV